MASNLNLSGTYERGSTPPVTLAAAQASAAGGNVHEIRLPDNRSTLGAAAQAVERAAAITIRRSAQQIADRTAANTKALEEESKSEEIPFPLHLKNALTTLGIIDDGTESLNNEESKQLLRIIGSLTSSHPDVHTRFAKQVLLFNELTPTKELKAAHRPKRFFSINSSQVFKAFKAFKAAGN